MGVFTFNGLTTPGYFMFLAWLLFSVIVALTFKEPERVGLNQLRDKTLSPVSSRVSSFCEDDKNGDDDDTAKAGIDENLPLLPPEGARGEANTNGMYAAVDTDAGADNDEDHTLPPIESADDDDCTGDITASTSDSSSRWLAFCINNFSLQVSPVAYQFH